MSRCNDFTNWFIAMNKREQRAFTLAYVWLARKPNLTESERRTLVTFKQVWFAGKDFMQNRTYEYFIAICKRHAIKIGFMKKPRETGRKGERGAMVEVEWSVEVNGSYWPAMKNGQGKRREVADLVRMKADYRLAIMHKEMTRLGITELTYEYGNIDNRIEQAIEERLREREPEPIQPDPAAEPVPQPNGLDYGFDYTTDTNVTVH
jgi:hypothetical protein